MVFLLEGLVIGKMLPTRIMLVVLVVFYSFQIQYVFATFFVVLMMSTLGQYILFRELYGAEEKIEESRWIRISDRKLELAEDKFAKYDEPFIAIANFLPVVRGLMTIPAAIEQMDSRKFALYSFLGSFIYFTIILGLSFFAADILLQNVDF